MLAHLTYSGRDRVALAHRANLAWRRSRHEAVQRLAFCLVLAEVHPGNLGALPPSPEVLRCKAQQIGLLSTHEALPASCLL